MTEYRTERDSMGEVQVPKDAYYSAQTQRAVENFPISGNRLPAAMIRAMGTVKNACAIANRDLGKLTGSGKNPLNDEQVAALLQATGGRWRVANWLISFRSTCIRRDLEPPAI